MPDNTPADTTVVRLTDEQLKAAGFAKRYSLCGHPAYPDTLTVWPPTEENAASIYEEYCTTPFEEYIAKLGFTPRYGGTPYSAETFNPRVLISWVYVGDREIFVPPGQSNGSVADQ